MKYYIVGKTSEAGPTYDSSGDLNSYYELGWELMLTHINIKKMGYEGLISDDDFVVTATEERKFLYESQFKNVISWDEFIINHNKNVEMVDLVGMSFGGVKMDDIIYDENLKKELFKFKKSDNIKSKVSNIKFVCLQFRKRVWCDDRNVDETFFKSLIDFFINEHNLKVFIMGLGSEIFCDEKNSFYVNLQEFTTLINDENCLFFYSTMSGPAHLSYFFSHKNLVHIVNDLSGIRLNGALKDHPLMMGDAYNYTQTNVTIVPLHQTIEDFKKIIYEKIRL